jgi:hypothetical protein
MSSLDDSFLQLGGHLEFSLRGWGDGHTEASHGRGGHRGPDRRSKYRAYTVSINGYYLFLTIKDPQHFNLQSQ